MKSSILGLFFTEELTTVPRDSPQCFDPRKEERHSKKEKKKGANTVKHHNQRKSLGSKIKK